MVSPNNDKVPLPRRERIKVRVQSSSLLRLRFGKSEKLLTIPWIKGTLASTRYGLKDIVSVRNTALRPI
jgi:hypothetical protein